ncbi:MAG: TldD/PmbA family protein, partial [Vulcanococcus sp.]
MSQTNQSLNAEQLRSQLEGIAQQHGIRQWDLGAACSTDTSVQVDRGEPKQLKGAQRSSI